MTCPVFQRGGASVEMTVTGGVRPAPPVLTAFAGQWWRQGRGSRCALVRLGLPPIAQAKGSCSAVSAARGLARLPSGVSVRPKTTLCGHCPGKSGPGTALLTAAALPSAWEGTRAFPQEALPPAARVSSFGGSQGMGGSSGCTGGCCLGSPRWHCARAEHPP